MKRGHPLHDPDSTPDSSDEFPDRHHHRKHGRHHQGRLFEYGELRLLLLAMLAEQPRHGYELIKMIEERMDGRYSPSPGVMYPTLAWLDDMGYANPEVDQAGRKRFRITSEGEAFLVANRAAADELLARAGPASSEPVPTRLVQAIENFKHALRHRLRQGGIDAVTAEAIAAALDTATEAVEVPVSVNSL